MDGKEEIERITLRIPAKLHEEVMRFAVGDGKRPKSSLNEAILFLVRVGLSEHRQSSKAEAEPGNWVPELLAA